jgi:transposase
LSTGHDVANAPSAATKDAMLARVAELEAALAAARARVAEMEAKYDRIVEAYQALQRELILLRRRIFLAKAERIDTGQLEMEFAAKLALLDAMGKELPPPGDGAAPAADDGSSSAATTDGASPPPAAKRRPRGRRKLRDLDVPETRIELRDPLLEGQEPFDWEESVTMGWRPGTPLRIITARAKYRVPSATPSADGATTTVATAPLPPSILPRSLAAPSLLAHIVCDKHCDGLPLHRQADRFARVGFALDRGTMSRWLEDLGMTVGSTVVFAMRNEALHTAFCIATDATGVLVQPIRSGDEPRRACKRGHFLVQIADADHVFFEYLPRETSAAIGELFRGFSGYVQADAKSVYDLLYRPPDQRATNDDEEPDPGIRHEVGCWCHLRRKAWEAAILLKDPVAREMLARIRRIFQLESTWRSRPPDEIKSLRDLHLRAHVEAFFAWARVEFERVKDRRGPLRSALGYAVRQEGALTRFLEDGRLVLDNNRSERELRRLAVGRKAWLFCGSDDHAQAAGNLLTLIASARLHRLNPELYLRDLFRVLPHWPRDRYLELAPKYWSATRARLDAKQLAAEFGPLTVPDPAPPATEQSSPR